VSTEPVASEPLAAGHGSGVSVGIAGGGIIGMSIAWRLAQQGCAVTVFDKGTIGGEASWAGAGMLAPGGEVEAASRLASLSIESRRLYRSFVQELEGVSGCRIDYQECGSLDLAYSPEELDALEDRARRQAEINIASKPVTAAQVSAFWPRVRIKDLVGARFYPGDAIVNPREIIAALARACEALGVALVENCPVVSAAVEGHRILLKTCNESRPYHAMVIAAGAWSDSIAITGVPPLPVAEPVKGHLIGYAQPEQTCNTIVRHGHTYLLQRANGLLIAGASVEHVGFNRQIDPDITSELAAAAGFVLPHLQETAPSEKWIGFRPASDDLHLDTWHSDRLYLAYGHYRNGILLAPLTARDLARQISANLRTR
jgi:glycine oxidase